MMLASYARWEEQGAKSATQPIATPAQPAPPPFSPSPRHSASGAGCGILPT